MAGDILLPAIALAVGIKHGVDWDHIAAIMDITATQHSRRRGVFLSFLYAVGHASVVATLATAGLLLGMSLPEGIDELMEKLVGLTLLMLGGYVIYSVHRNRAEEFRLMPRWVIAANALLKLLDWVKWKVTGTPARSRRVKITGYGNTSACVVGMIHGIGAETPTQVMLFALTLGAGASAGRDTALLLILAFVTGLIITNTAMGILGAYGMTTAAGRERIHRTLAMGVGIFSLILGVVFILGLTPALPDIQALL
ncbi:HoxN/HupN/NixA family nickel/cobalt transporter [Candidatus Pyrohabitans sp.]